MRGAMGARHLVHDGQQNLRFVEIVLGVVAHGRDLFEVAVLADVIDPGRHQHAAAMGECFEKFHIVEIIVRLGHGAKLAFIQTVRVER